MRGRVAFLDRTQNHQNKPRKCVRSSSRLEFRLLSVGGRKFFPRCGPLRLEPISIRRRPWSGVSGTRPEVGVGRVGVGVGDRGPVPLVGAGRVGAGRVGDRGPVPLVGAGRVGVAGRDARYRSGPARVGGGGQTPFVPSGRRVGAIENPGRIAPTGVRSPGAPGGRRGH